MRHTRVPWGVVDKVVVSLCERQHFFIIKPFSSLRGAVWRIRVLIFTPFPFVEGDVGIVLRSRLQSPFVRQRLDDLFTRSLNPVASLFYSHRTPVSRRESLGMCSTAQFVSRFDEEDVGEVVLGDEGLGSADTGYTTT